MNLSLRPKLTLLSLAFFLSDQHGTLNGRPDQHSPNPFVDPWEIRKIDPSIPVLNDTREACHIDHRIASGDIVNVRELFLKHLVETMNLSIA